MFSRRRRRTARPVRRNPVLQFIKIIALFVVPFILWMFADLPLLNKYFSIKSVRDQRKAEVQKLQDEIAAKKIEKEQLSDSQFADEALARERFQYVKPGEKLYLIQMEGEEK